MIQITHFAYVQELTNPPILLMNFFREAGGGIFQTVSSLFAGKE